MFKGPKRSSCAFLIISAMLPVYNLVKQISYTVKMKTLTVLTVKNYLVLK